ncbi:hypothetical protein GX48_08222 [Paracoccidioides brasiliensis]|nr:hypothetical protein GX48_08222 [Paracoccidioides brasiliensis]
MKVSRTDLMTSLKPVLIKSTPTLVAECFTYEGLYYTNRCLKKTSNYVINQVKFDIMDSLSDLENDFSKSDDKAEN